MNNFIDPRNGFRHKEVVGFINEEILSNGGSPELFKAYPLWPWNKVEDQLQAVLADPQVPRAVKRAYTWSALALSMRLATKQREQQVHQIQRLKDQLEDYKATTWSLASGLQQLREENKDMASRLRSTTEALQQVLEERERLHERLQQAERSAQIKPQVMTWLQGDQLGAEVWPQNSESQGKMAVAGAKDRLHVGSQKEEAQPGAHTGLFCLPGFQFQGHWTQVIQPGLPLPHSHPFPHHPPFPVAVPYLPCPAPIVVMEPAAAAAAVPPQMASGRIHTPGLWAPVESQEMAPLWNQRSQGKMEGAVRLNFMNPSEHRWSHGDPGIPPQEQNTWPPTAAGTSDDAEEAPAS